MPPRPQSAKVAVVGSGIGGSMAAAKLAERGFAVTLIERGMALTEEQRERIVAAGTFAARAEGISRGLTRREPGGKPIRRIVPTVEGGLAEFYQAVKLRFRPEDWADWPFAYAEIEPYYAEAERRLGAKVPHLDLPPGSQMLADAAIRTGARPEMHPLAIDFETCRLGRICNQIPCPSGARFSPSRYVRSVDGLTILNGEVAAVGEEPGSARILLRGGGELSADGVVLCAGGLETPAILMRSGLGGPLAGRNLMLHGLGTVQGLFAKPVSRDRTFEKRFSLFDYYLDEEGVRGIIQQDQLPAIERYQDKMPGWAWNVLDRAYDHFAKLLYMVADEARPENRIALDRDGKLEVIYEPSARDQRRMHFLAERASEILRAAGAFWVSKLPNHSIFHACGTARMGLDPETSVLDPQGRVHGTRRIHVADASVFCSAGGVNPSLTVAANALRIADRLALP